MAASQTDTHTSRAPGAAGFQPATNGSRQDAGAPRNERADRVLDTHGTSRSFLFTGGVLLASYLYGSLPFVYLLGVQRHVDLKRSGSGNVGGSNLWAAAGTARGVAGWLGDASKGFLPILLARRLGCPQGVASLAAVCGVAGQCWPLFLGFNGGRGISAFVGAGFLIDRTAWAVSLLPMIGGALWRVVPLLRRSRRIDAQVRATRSKAVPLGCVAGVVTFALACSLRAREGAHPRQAATLAPTLLALLLLLRRATAPLPDDATYGPSVRRRALLYRLLYDRNTSN